MHFKTKISRNRQFNTSGSVASSLESDRGRIINCAALRRLQQKTQVFPLERNAAVRSRLTHSLEVQQNGRFIAKKIINKLKEQDDFFTYTNTSGKLVDLSESLITLSEMACLMHDIGNPAFGHFGEAAINDWFKRYLKQHHLYSLSTKEAFDKDKETSGTKTQKELSTQSQLLLDICSFEGNAQAIRIINTLSSLNLTYSQAASILKYTRCATVPKYDVEDDFSYLKKKVGYYFSEKEFVADMCDKLEIPLGNRHPVAYIMEAADDIAYCLADIEDAVEKGILSLTKFETEIKSEYSKILNQFQLQTETDYLASKLQEVLKQNKGNQFNIESDFFIRLRVALLHPLVEHASERFLNNLEPIFNGSFNQSLLEDKSHLHAVAESLKVVARKHVFSAQEVEQLELQGYKITSGILDEYKRVLDLTPEDFKSTLENPKSHPIESRLLNRISPKFINIYKQAIANLKDEEKKQPIFEYYYRCRLIQDFISGMTDQFAYDTYRTLNVKD